MTAAKQVIDDYQSTVLIVQPILGDGQFQHIGKHLERMGSILDITGCDQHIPEIERYIRTVEKQVWSTVNRL